MALKELDQEIAKAEFNFNGWKKRLEHLKRQRDQHLASERDSKPRGRNGGRKPALTPEQIQLAQNMVDTHSLEIIAAKLKVSTRTLERYKIRAAFSACNL